MDAYPCPACGGAAVEPTGCRRCGRAHDPQAAELAVLNRRLAALAPDAPERAALHDRAQELRTALRRALALETSQTVRVPDPDPPAPATTTHATSAHTTSAHTTSAHTTSTAAAPTMTASPPVDPWPAHDPPPAPVPPASVPHQRPHHEAAPGSDRTLLILGALLLSIAGIVVTGLAFSAAPVGGRSAMVVAATLVLLALPLLLARKTLNATAESLAAVGLLLMLLDGYAAYAFNILGLGSHGLLGYSSVLFGLVAAVAAAYRLASHLRAPQFATLLAVQPVLPLFAAAQHAGRDGFAVVFAVVAALNLASVEVLGRDPGRALRAVLIRIHLPGLRPGPGGQPWPPRLRELAWVFFGATLATSVVLAGISLVVARSAAEAAGPALVLLLAAGIGVAAGLLARRAPYGQIGGGGAAFVLVVAVGRVIALAAPEHALTLSAGLAAAVALSCLLLPARARPGPRWGSLAGAGLTGLIVLSYVVRTTVQAVGAAVTPGIWHADVQAYSDRIPVLGGWVGTVPQLPVAAVLLTLLAVTAVPATWRVDALVAGLGVVTLCLPGTGALAWWAVPLVSWAAATVALACALPAHRGASVAIRAGCGGLLGLVALVTALARPWTTAVTCGLVAGAAALAVLIVSLDARGRPRFGPYASRVTDMVAAVGVCALPAAAATVASLSRASGELLVTITLLAAAGAVAAALVGQVAAQRVGTWRPGSATGALLAAGGALVVALQVAGSTRADLAVAGVLLAAALVAFTARTATPPDPAGPGTDPITGSDAVRPWRVDGPGFAAALATAALALSLARVGAVLVPGIGLIVTTATVLVVAMGIVVLPPAWRPGPRVGGAAVGAGAVALAAGVAAVEAARALAGVWPFWSSDNLADWVEVATAFTLYGRAVPISLGLAALAALLLVPRPANVDVSFVLVCLGVLAVPAVTGGPWWTASLYAGVLAVVAGAAAALTRPTDPWGTHRRRLALAGLLAGYAIAAGAANQTSTATVLFGLTAASAMIAAAASRRHDLAPSVAGICTAAALACAPAAAACVALGAGLGRDPSLAVAVGGCALGVVVVIGLRAAHGRILSSATPARGSFWSEQGTGDGYPGLGVGVAALAIAAAAAIPQPTRAPAWAAICALFATIAAGHSRRPPLDDDDDPPATRVVVATLAVTAMPTALFAAAATAQAWALTLWGPFRTIEHIWQGWYPPPEGPHGATTALLTLLLLTPTGGGMALILGGRRYLLAAVLPPLAAAAVVLPGALGAPPRAVPWVALGVALAAGLGAALSRPVIASAATWLRATAGLVCLVTGAAGLAGSLATRATTLIALGVLGAGALAAALAGHDPVARAVAWVVVAAAGLGMPPTASVAAPSLQVAPASLRTAAFGMFGVCAALVVLAWLLSRWRDRHSDATVLELAAAVGAGTALALVAGSRPHLAAGLTICGLLLGAAALRADRDPLRRVLLVWGALALVVAACWLFLSGVTVDLVAEAYTVPFAVAALLAGAAEQWRRPELSSWITYGPGLAGAFLPSVVLVLSGQDPVWRWVGVFGVALAVVVLGTMRGWRAPVVTGSAIAVVVAIVKMVRFIVNGDYGGALIVALAGVALIVIGAFSERSLRRGAAP